MGARSSARQRSSVPGPRTAPVGGAWKLSKPQVLGLQRQIRDLDDRTRYLLVSVFTPRMALYYNEHGAPHFHAVYGEHKITIEIESGHVKGEFPPRALRLVLEWTSLHRQELVANWERARRREPLARIEPLE